MSLVAFSPPPLFDCLRPAVTTHGERARQGIDRESSQRCVRAVCTGESVHGRRSTGHSHRGRWRPWSHRAGYASSAADCCWWQPGAHQAGPAFGVIVSHRCWWRLETHKGAWITHPRRWRMHLNLADHAGTPQLLQGRRQIPPGITYEAEPRAL